MELIKSASVTTRDDVFQELPEKAAISAGYADLYILASLKTHKPGIYPFEKKPHGTADYMLLLNIDGEATPIKGTLKEENSEARFPMDPEAGEGIRYRFGRDLRLKAGTHRVVVAFPDDGVAVEREITLSEGKNNLVLEPIYGATPGKQRPGFYGITSFKEGIKWFRLKLNGQDI